MGMFTKSVIAHLIIKRGFYVMAVYSMMLNSAIMASLASHAGLPIVQEMFFYMQFFGYAGTILLFHLVWRTLVDVLELWKQQKEDIRIGPEF